MLIATPQREAHAGTFDPALGLQVFFSPDSVCGNADDTPDHIYVPANSHGYVCHRVQNNSNITLYNVEIQDVVAPVPGSQTLSPGQTIYYRGDFTAVTSTLIAFTATGSNAVGDTFLVGPATGQIFVETNSLSIQKTVTTAGANCPGVESASVPAGTQVKYCYEVKNTGTSALNNIVLNDNGFTLLVGSLLPGHDWFGQQIKTIAVSECTPASASGVSVPAGSQVSSPPDPACVTVFAGAAQLSISTTVTTNGVCPGQEIVNVLAGTGLTWCYVVKNLSNNRPVTSVQVTDDVFGLIPGPVTLQPQQTFTWSKTDVSSVDITHTAQAKGFVLGNPTASNLDPAAVNVVGPMVDIDVTVSTDGNCPGEDVVTVPTGTTVNYCYLVTNVGDDQLVDVDVNNADGLLGSIASLDVGQAVMIQGSSMIATSEATETAHAIGTDIYGFGVYAEDLAKVHVTAPKLAIEKTVSTDGSCPGTELVTVLAGTTVTYCYDVINIGDSVVNNISVTDQDGTVISVGNLAPGASATVSASFTATVDVGTLATASGLAITGAPVVSDPDGAAVDIIAPALSIEKTVSTNGFCPGVELVSVLSGTLVTYCYEVINTGDVPVTGVVVEDDGILVSIGDLAPGQMGGGGASLTITVDTDTPAVATGVSPIGSPVMSPPNDAAVDVIAPALSIQKTASVDGSCPGVELVTVLSGTPVAYCYTVTNTGDATVTNITVQDNGATIVISDLVPGQSATVSATVVITANENTPAAAIGVAQPTGTPVASPPDSAAVEVVAPALAIQKTVSTDGNCPGSELVTVLAGTQVTYCYSVTNTGDTAVHGVTVEDNGVFIAIGDLAAGQSGNGVSSIIALVDTNTSAVASGTTTATGTPVQSAPDGAAVDVITPALAIQKTVSTDGNCPGSELVTVLAGTQVTYCYSVTNTGDTPVSNIVVNDSTSSVAIGNLEPGQTGGGTILFTAVVDTNTTAVANGTTTATGTAISSLPDGAAVDVINPELSIQKTVSTTGACPGTELVTVLVGAQVTYCYSVTNTGDTAISNITVNDTTISLPVGNLGPGQSASTATTITAVADTNTPAVASGTTTATGTAIASPPDSAAVDVITPALSISVTVSLNGACPGEEVVNVLAGTQVTWCYVVTNTGDTLVDDVVVTDNQYGVVPGTIPSLQPGESATLSMTVSAPADITLTASAAGDVPATGTTVQSPQDPAVVNVVSPNIDIDVTVSTDGNCPGADSVTVAAETSVVYCYSVVNNGDDTLTNVVVTDPAGNVIGTIAELDSGESTTFASGATVILGDTTVTATATGTDVYGYPVSDTDAAIVHALFAKIAIQKTVSTTGVCPGSELVTVLSGTNVTFCYLVTNSGETAITSITANDNGRVIAVSDLAPGQSAMVSAQAAVTAPENTPATAKGVNAANNKPVNSAPDTAAVEIVHPSLDIEKTASLNGTCPGVETVTVLAGTQVTWCYVVTNTGDTTIGDIVVIDAGVTVSVGTLASGASSTVSSTVVSTSEDLSTAAIASGTDTATWTHVNSDPDSAAIDVIHPALSITTTVSTDGNCPGLEVVNVLSGTSVKWCYVVQNTGDVPVNNVKATDDKYGLVPGNATNLAVGASVTFSRVKTENDDITLTASATGVDAVLGSGVTSNLDSAAVNVVNPSIDIDVTVKTSGNCPGADSITVTAGTQVVNCYIVTNLGDDTLTNLVVKDANGVVIKTLSTLASGASYSFSTPAAAINQLTNVVGTVTAVDIYGYPVSDSDTAIVKVNTTNIKVVKTAPATVKKSSSGGGCGGGGSSEANIKYTIVVTNTGTATASSVVMTDVMPAGVSYENASVSGNGCSCSYSSQTKKVTCTLGNLAPGASKTITINVTTELLAGTVTNTASATTTTPESDLTDNSSTASTIVYGGGATRTIGFWGNHPSFTAACIAANGGSINLGYTLIKNEQYDNQIDVDNDNQVETALELAIGSFKLNISKFSNGQSRSALQKARVKAGRQVLAAICNATYLGTEPTFNLTAAIATLSGTNVSAIDALNNTADAFNNSNDDQSLPVNPGPANSNYPWDDGTDASD